MSNESISPDPELIALEAALGSLAPARTRIDRDRVMFRAGQAAVCPPTAGRRTWGALAAGLALVALGEAALLAGRPSSRVVEKVVVVREPATSPVLPPTDRTVVQDSAPPAWHPSGGPLGLGETAYERLAGQVLRYGLDGLPAPLSAAWAGPEPGPAPSRQRLQEELRNVLDLGDPS